jgi:hypothetical protein
VKPKPRQILPPIVSCAAVTKKGKPCPFRKRFGEFCGHHDQNRGRWHGMDGDGGL